MTSASSPSHKPTVQPSQPKPRLRLIPLDDTVVFPNMGITLTIDVGDDERVVLVPRHEGEFLEVGTIAEVSEQIRLPGGGRAVAISGEHRALIGAAQTGPGGELLVEVDERPDQEPTDKRTRELEREYRATVEEILELRGADARTAGWLRAISEPGMLADSAGYSPDLTYEQRLELLRTIDVTERLELALKLQRERFAELQIRKRIRDDVQQGADKQQRDYFLRKQMDSIRKELGEDDASIVEEYRAKIEAAEMPEEAHEQADALAWLVCEAHGPGRELVVRRRVEHLDRLAGLQDQIERGVSVPPHPLRVRADVVLTGWQDVVVGAVRRPHHLVVDEQRGRNEAARHHASLDVHAEVSRGHLLRVLTTGGLCVLQAEVVAVRLRVSLGLMGRIRGPGLRLIVRLVRLSWLRHTQKAT